MMVCRKEKEENVKASVICDRGLFVVTVHSYILVGRFHACMRICLHECTKGAPVHEHCVLQTQQRSCEAAESAESAVKPSAEGFANGAE